MVKLKILAHLGAEVGQCSRRQMLPIDFQDSVCADLVVGQVIRFRLKSIISPRPSRVRTSELFFLLCLFFQLPVISSCDIMQFFIPLYGGLLTKAQLLLF